MIDPNETDKPDADPNNQTGGVGKAMGVINDAMMGGEPAKGSDGTMMLAEGGAIEPDETPPPPSDTKIASDETPPRPSNSKIDPDGDGDADDADPNAKLTPDKMPSAADGAMAIVKAALDYGRQKFGLAGGAQQQQPDQQAQPNPDENSPDQGSLAPDQPAGSYEDGGPVTPVDESVEPDVNAGMQAENNSASPARPMQYMQGADAEDPQHVQALEQQVDPGELQAPGDRKLAAVQAAHAQGGTAAAWRVLQAYRKYYDTYRHHAAAALRAGDVQNAVNSANQAFHNIPDGQNVVFRPAQSGVTATVMPRRGA